MSIDGLSDHGLDPPDWSPARVFTTCGAYRESTPER